MTEVYEVRRGGRPVRPFKSSTSAPGPGPGRPARFASFLAAEAWARTAVPGGYEIVTL